MRTIALLTSAERPDPKACSDRIAFVLEAEGAVLVEAPGPVYSDFDLFAVIALGAAHFGLHFDYLTPRKGLSIILLSLTQPPTGPPGVGVCPPVEDDETTRGLLAAMDRALGLVFPGVERRFCEPDEVRGLIDALCLGDK